MEKENLKESYVTPEITIEEILPIARTCGGGGCGCGGGTGGCGCGCGDVTCGGVSCGGGDDGYGSCRP